MVAETQPDEIVYEKEVKTVSEGAKEFPSKEVVKDSELTSYEETNSVTNGLATEQGHSDKDATPEKNLSSLNSDKESNELTVQVSQPIKDKKPPKQDYDSMFPALTPSHKNSTVSNGKSTWGRGNTAASQSTESSGDVRSASSKNLRFQIPENQMSGPISTYSTYLLDLQKDHQVRIDISTIKSTGSLAFIISPSNLSSNVTDDVLKLVRRKIVSKISKKLEAKITVPSHLLKFVIGNKGKSLSEIRQASSCDIKVPNKMDSTDEEEEAFKEISIVGDFDGVQTAKDLIQKIVDDKESKIVTKLEIKRAYLPFLFGYETDTKALGDKYNGISVRVAASSGEDVAEVVLSGEKDDVNDACMNIEKSYSEMQRKYKTLSISIKKRQHRFLIGPKGQNLAEILRETGCCVEVPSQQSSDDSVTIRGPEASLVLGLQMALGKANTVWIEELEIPSSPFGKFCWKYLLYKERTVALRKLEQDFSVQIFMNQAAENDLGSGMIEIQGKKEEVLKAKSQLESLIKAVSAFSFREVQLAHELHRFIFQKTNSNLLANVKLTMIKLKNGTRLVDALKEIGVELIAPPSNNINLNSAAVSTAIKTEEELDRVILFVKELDMKTLTKKNGSADHLLQDVVSEFLSVMSKLGELVTSPIRIEPKFHARLIGHHGKGVQDINDYVKSKNGPDAVVSVKFPNVNEKVDSDNADVVVVRGVDRDVEVAVEHIKKLVEAYRHHDFLHSHEQSLEVKEPVFKKLIQKSSVFFQQIRENPNVRLSFNDKDKNTIVIHLQGVKKDVEVVQAEIKKKVERQSNEVTLKVKIDPQFHGVLIGKGGQTVKRLVSKYEVNIQFPKTNAVSDDTQDETPDDPHHVTIIGHSKDAEAVKQELLDLVKWEQDHAHYLAFLVSKSTVKSLLSKNGFGLETLRAKLEKKSSDLTGVDFVDGLKEKESTEKKIGASPGSYDGADLIPDEDRSLCVLSGAKDVLKQFTEMMMKYEKEEPVYVVAQATINPQVFSWWVGSGKMRYKKLLLTAAFKTKPDLFSGKKVPKNFESLSEWVSLASDDEFISFVEENACKASFPPKKKVLEGQANSINIRGETKTVECFKELYENLNQKLMRDRFPLTKKHIGRVVGSGGQQISQLRTDFDVDIEISASNESKESEEMISLIGLEDNISRCKAKIEDLIKSASSVEQLNVVEPQSQNQFSKHVAAPKRLFRHIVGPSGTVANQIRSEFNVQLIIPNPNSKESDIKVVGEPSNVEKAIIRINEILAKHVSSY